VWIGSKAARLTWIVAGYLAVGFLVALIVRPLTPVAWVAHIAGWPLVLLILLYLMREEIVVTALVVGVVLWMLV
jgi:hypothetical protein